MATARLYDLTLLLDPNAPDDRHREILGNVNSAIEDKGKLVGQHDWGMRRLAFEIDHRADAAYHLFQFEAGSDLLQQLESTLKITDGVLRHRSSRSSRALPRRRPPAPSRREAPVRPRSRAAPSRPAPRPTPRLRRPPRTRQLTNSPLSGWFRGGELLHHVRFCL